MRMPRSLHVKSRNYTWSLKWQTHKVGHARTLTTCAVWMPGEHGYYPSVGVAILAPNDKPSLEGTKLAMARALKAVPRHDRLPIWKAYFAKIERRRFRA